eukprot:403351092
MQYSSNQSNSKNTQQKTSSLSANNNIQTSGFNQRMSNSNHDSDSSNDIQFRVLSKSPQKQSNRIKNNPHVYENVYDVMGKPNQTQKLSQIVMNESSDIFNDGVEGGGVEPSINESIRQSIQCSFVSSECNETKQQYKQQEMPSIDAQKSLQVMNRMNWITYLKVLFDQLESFNQNKLKHVETANFLKGLKKIKHLLPLQTRNQYFKNCSEVAFSYKEVESGVIKMPEYITWDNIIDVFLTKSFAQSIVNQQPQTTKQQQRSQFQINNIFSTQMDSDDNQGYDQMKHHQQQPNNRDESKIISDIDYEEGGEIDHSYRKQQSANENKGMSYPQVSSEKRHHKNSSSISNSNHQRNLSKPMVVVNNIGMGSMISNNNNDNQSKKRRNDDFYPSFADSLINYGGTNNHMINSSIDNNQQSFLQNHQYHNSQNQQQIIAQAPLMLQNPNIGLNERDDDEACEIDSDYSSSIKHGDDDEGDDSHNQDDSQQRKRNRKLEESIRSSRTATFKTVRRTSTQNNNTSQMSQQYANQQHAQITNALSQAVNVQDSYYATIQSSTMQQQNYGNNIYQNVNNQYQNGGLNSSRHGQEISSNSKSLQQQNTNNSYYNLQHSSYHQKTDSRNSSGQNRGYNPDLIEDGQVEVASNHSYGSSKWRNMENQNNSQGGSGSVRIDLVSTFEDQHHNYEKSTRISSLNSIQKAAQQMHQGQNILQTSLTQLQNNNTIISHNSSQSSHSQQQNQNNSKQSIGTINSLTQHSSNSFQSNFIDLDLQGKGLKTFEIDCRNGMNDKRQIRSLNLSNNSLIKLPSPLEKTIIYMNVSYNKLKSLTGIESCVNLKFLNVSGNQLSSASNLVILQSMRELVFAYNQLSILKELGQLKNLQLLDLSHNKISEIEKVMPLQSCKKLSILSLQGNIVEKHINYDNILKKMLPQVKVQDPDQIKDFSQFSDMEHVCFTDPPANANQSQLIIVEQLSSMNLRQFASHEKEREKPQELQKPRSRTPNRERAKSQLGQQLIDQKLKSMVISPQREEDKRTSNIFKPGAGYNTNVLNQHKLNKSPVYNDQQFKMQSKYQSSTNKISSARPSKGNITNRNQVVNSQLSRERSTTNEFNQKDKSQTRMNKDRSTSNISRNVQGKQVQSAQGYASGRSTAQQITSNNLTLNSQYTNQTTKDPVVKKVSLNSNAGKYISSQGKITPRANTAQQQITYQTTPKHEKGTHQYKKSFCQTEDDASLISSNKDRESLNINVKTQGTPSEKNALRSVPTQDSSNKKASRVVTKITMKDPNQLQSARQKILSPTTVNKNSMCKDYVASLQGNKNSSRPVTTLKQRQIGGTSALQQDSADQRYSQFNNTTNLSQLQGNNNLSTNLVSQPGSTKNQFQQQKVSNSFVLENGTFQSNQNPGGRQTPVNQNISNRPSSQLQKFIIASQKPQSQNQQITVTTSRPSTSHTQMSFHQVPSQKLTNLPPRAYQTKNANPGDKKNKADMSLSVISNGNQGGNNYMGMNSGPTGATNTSQINNTILSSQSSKANQNSLIMQQHQQNFEQYQQQQAFQNQMLGISNQDMVMLESTNNYDDFTADCQIDDISSRSMSPVLEESNNIKKLKVDLTQYMNKQ